MVGSSTNRLEAANRGKSTANGSAVEDASQAITPKGGLTDFIEQIQLSWTEAVKTGDLTSLNDLCQTEGQFWERECAIAEARADAALNLADSLQGQPQSPTRDAQWLELLKNDFEPGPYSRYVITKLGDGGSTDGVIRDRLSEIQIDWREKYDDNISYRKDLAILAGALERPTTGPGNIIQALSSIFKR